MKNKQRVSTFCWPKLHANRHIPFFPLMIPVPCVSILANRHAVFLLYFFFMSSCSRLSCFICHVAFVSMCKARANDQCLI
ncbi:hypothetical protein F5Y17DRAFT_438304 [Xylariaceae sp. FL0594]|nr:hypothetical protein F5Y17DRAFT_438304 [Xylariaceae sp. FL0594]